MMTLANAKVKNGKDLVAFRTIESYLLDTEKLDYAKAYMIAFASVQNNDDHGYKEIRIILDLMNK